MRGKKSVRERKKYTHFQAKLIVSMAEIVVKPNKRPSTVGRKYESVDIFICMSNEQNFNTDFVIRSSAFNILQEATTI